jgi:hypothetical protein
MNKILIFQFLLMFLGSGLYAAAGDVNIDTIENYNNWNKTALVIKNGFIELVILPEIGGRVIKYGFEGDSYMAVNEDRIDQSFNPDTDNNGPWNGSWGYGGYKVWPAPQSKWNWPPPPHLAWGPYTYEIRHSSVDSVVVYLESEEETSITPGLVFTRKYKVYKNSTKVFIEQTIINKNSTDQNWSIWDVTQAIVQHNNEADYSNFSVYFPVNRDDIFWSKDNSLNGNVLSVDNSVSKFKFNSTSGKLYSFVNNGWACFVDEKDSETYAKLFSVETGDFPDGGANFEIYAGGEYIEIEVLSPIKKIAANSGTYTYNEEWYAANLNGSILKTNRAGAVKSRLSLNLSRTNVTGEFGIFNTGILVMKYFDISNVELGTSNPIVVEAAANLVFNESVSLPEGTDKIQLLAYDENEKLIEVLDSWGYTGSSIDDETLTQGIMIYPTVCKQGETVHVLMKNSTSRPPILSLVDINSRTIVFINDFRIDNNSALFEIPEIADGIYFLKVQTHDQNYVQKIIIN